MRIKTLLAPVVTAAALLALSSCGGTSDDDTAPASGQDQQQGQGQQAQDRGFQGASGKIAAITGTTLQVQNATDGQVAVTYTDSTTVSAQVAASATDVQVGACVMVTPAQSSSSSSDSSTVAAGSVRITEPVDGECTGGFGGAGRPGGGRNGGPGGMVQDGEGPDGTPPTDLPRPEGGGSGGNNGAPPSGANLARIAVGKVTAVTASGFTVESSLPSAPSGSDDSSDSSDDSQSVSVTTSDATTWTKTVASDASALTVGSCVVATGDHDSTGAVTATSIQVSDPVDGECSAGFGRRFGNGGRANGQNDGQGSGQGDAQTQGAAS